MLLNLLNAYLFLDFIFSLDAGYLWGSNSKLGGLQAIISNVTCSGSEFRLTDCEYDNEIIDANVWYNQLNVYCQLG